MKVPGEQISYLTVTSWDNDSNGQMFLRLHKFIRGQWAPAELDYLLCAAALL